MADDVTLNASTGTFVAATDDVGGKHYQKIKLAFGPADTATLVESSAPLPVTLGLTDAQLRATAVPMSVASLPLPTGAATEAKQDDIIGTLNNLLQDGPVTIANFPTKAEDSPAVSGDLGFPMLAMRQLADTTSTDTDGDYTIPKVDEEGRVKVATKPASYVATTGNITTNGGIVWVNCARASNIVFSMVATSLVGHNVSFEVSNNTTNGSDGNWYGMQAIRTNANTIETASGVLAATPAYGWEVSVNGWNAFRVRATAHTSGTAAYILQPGSYATEPIPGAQVSGTQPVSGTVTATVGTSISGGTISPLTVAGVTVEASAARTTTANGTTITNASARGAHFIFNVSASSGTTPTLVGQLQVQDSVSSNWIDVPGAATVSITTTGTYMLTVCPGIAETANSRVNNALPRTFRFRWTIGGTTPSFTFSISAQYII